MSGFTSAVDCFGGLGTVRVALAVYRRTAMTSWAQLAYNANLVDRYGLHRNNVVPTRALFAGLSPIRRANRTEMFNVGGFVASVRYLYAQYLKIG